MANPLKIDPPLLNSACPWATTLEDIKALYDCPYTGAVTTRTSLLEGFSHDDAVHQFVFHTAGRHVPAPAEGSNGGSHGLRTAQHGASSLNTLGYSPITLSEYLGYINEIVGQRHLGTDTPTKKPFILSVTGTPDEIAMAYALIANAAEMDEDLRLCMEVNLSCPNIAATKAPPAYDAVALGLFLEAIGDSKSTYRGRMEEDSVPKVGLKLPPYTYAAQFEMLVEALRDAVLEDLDGGKEGKSSFIDFVTSTNTLGNCLVTDAEGKPVLNSESGTGLGGLAGAALHPLSLGNVKSLRTELDRYDSTRGIMVIGVGGVEDKAGFDRMKGVGAAAVGLATSLGRNGVSIFEKISTGTGS